MELLSIFNSPHLLLGIKKKTQEIEAIPFHPDVNLLLELSHKKLKRIFFRSFLKEYKQLLKATASFTYHFQPSNKKDNKSTHLLHNKDFFWKGMWIDV